MGKERAIAVHWPAFRKHGGAASGMLTFGLFVVCIVRRSDDTMDLLTLRSVVVRDLKYKYFERRVFMVAATQKS